MSYNWNTRTELLLGADRMERLAHSHVLVVGLGGVGAYAAEQICRAGIGHMTIVDADTVNESQDGPVTSQDRGYLEDLQLRIGKSRTQTTARSGRQQRDSGCLLYRDSQS